jgi:hypothetical protein
VACLWGEQLWEVEREEELTEGSGGLPQGGGKAEKAWEEESEEAWEEDLSEVLAVWEQRVRQGWGQYGPAACSEEG